MPYSKVSDAPPSIQELDGVSLTLAQVNWIANVADGLDPKKVKSVWAVAIASFKRSFVKRGGSWVKRETKEVGVRGRFQQFLDFLGGEDETDVVDIDEELEVKALDPSGLKTGFKVFEVGDELRWIAITSNAYKDREEEIFETKVLQDYVAAVDSGEVPESFLAELKKRELPTNPHGELWFAHIPHSRIGESIWKGMEERFLIEVGKFDDTPIAQKIATHLKEHGEDYRVSQGYLYDTLDRADKVYSKPIWKFETSPLPKGWESNLWTAIGIIEQGGKVMDDKKKKALVEATGGDEVVVETFLKFITDHGKAIEEAGVEFKGKPVEPTEEDKPKPEPLILEKDSEAMKMITEAVAEAVKITELQEAVTTLAKAVQDIQKADQPLVVLSRKDWKRPSEDDKNIVSDEDAKKSIPAQTEKHPLDVKMGTA